MTEMNTYLVFTGTHIRLSVQYRPIVEYNHMVLPCPDGETPTHWERHVLVESLIHSDVFGNPQWRFVDGHVERGLYELAEITLNQLGLPLSVEEEQPRPAVPNINMKQNNVQYVATSVIRGTSAPIDLCYNKDE